MWGNEAGQELILGLELDRARRRDSDLVRRYGHGQSFVGCDQWGVQNRLADDHKRKMDAVLGEGRASLVGLYQ